MRDNTEAIMALATKLAYDSAEVGAKAENERIIKLLQDQGVLCGKGSREHTLRCALRIVGDGCNCDEVIALIKGEN